MKQELIDDFGRKGNITREFYEEKRRLKIYYKVISSERKGFYCECSRGRKKIIFRSSMKQMPLSCGCIRKEQMSKLGEKSKRDLIGMVFGSLKALEEIKKYDNVKEKFAKEKNIPLIRIPYYVKNSITIQDILGDKYLV